MSTLSSKFRLGATAVVIAAGLSVSFITLAQPGPGFGHGMMGGGPGMMGGCQGMMMGGGHGRMWASRDSDFAKFQQERLGQLKAQLAITPAQQSAWDAFASTAAEQVTARKTMPQPMATGTAPERLARQQQIMGEHLKAMGAMSEALNKLYELLTPQQRAVFDQAQGPMRHG